MSNKRVHLRSARRRTGVWKRLCGLSLREEAGFTLIELMVAGAVMATGLVTLAGVMTSGLVTTGYARERQSASQLANQAIEQIRALPFNTLKAGLSTGDPTVATDANITACGANLLCFGGEQVVTHPPDSQNDKLPLVNHTNVVTVGRSTYSVLSYVTYYQNVTTSVARRVTVNVTWASALKNGASKTVQAQTIVFAAFPGSGSGPGGSCLLPGNHPFPGPCQPSFTAHATQDAGTVTITDISGAVATIDTGRLGSDSDIEQVQSITGSAQASGASVTPVSGAQTSFGLSSVSSKADTDPDTSSALYDNQPLPAPANANTTVSFGSNSLTEQTTAGDSGGTTSTTSACTATCDPTTSPSSRPCPNLVGYGYSNETDSLSCGSANLKTGSANASMNLGSIGTLTFGSVGLEANASPTVAITNRNALTSGTTCTGDGCTRSQMSRAGVDLSAGGLPANLGTLPAILTSLVNGGGSFAQIQAVTDSAMAESGVNAAAPTASQSGTIKIFCATSIAGDPLCPIDLANRPLGFGFVSRAFNSITAPLSAPPLTQTVGNITIALTATITPGSVVCVPTCATGANTTKTAATATSTPPTVSIGYQITANNNGNNSTLLNTTIVLNPGVVSARTTYAAALTS